MKSIFIVFYIIMIHFSSAVIYRLNASQHELLPPTLHLDEYERCLRQPGGVYCTALLHYVTDETSALFTLMQEYSAYAIRHYNYTRAFYGTCLDKCTKGTDMDPQHSLEACLNRTIWNEYKLKVRIVDEFLCVDDNHRRIPIDEGGIAMTAVCLILVMLNVIASIYDVYFSSQNHGRATYLLLSFSIRRNWRDLVAPADSKDERYRRLRGINGIRALTIAFVVLGHAVMFPLLVSDTPIFFEEQYDIVSTHILMNGQLIMQTFIIISAFLLVYFMIEEQQKVSWKLLPSKILKRWLRLTPSYAVMLGITATWLNNIGDGPLWNHLVTLESEDCKKYWWRHILFINNYFDGSQCMPQAWYIAADFQLHCLGVFVFCLCRNQTSKKVVLTALFLTGLVLPGLHTYFQDLDAIVLFTPTAAQSAFIYDPTFNSLYKRSHNNLAGFIMGMALGYLVYKLQKNNSKREIYMKWRPLYWAMAPACFCIPLLCKFFYVEGPRVDVWWRTAISCVIRPGFGVTVSIILVGTILKIETVYRGFLEWHGWRVMSRASYSAYLVHLALVKAAASTRSRAVATTYIYIFQSVTYIMVSTCIAALVFHLSVTAPLNKLVKICDRPPTPTTDNKSQPTSDMPATATSV